MTIITLYVQRIHLFFSDFFAFFHTRFHPKTLTSQPVFVIVVALLAIKSMTLS
jgi:hypothetical protein